MKETFFYVDESGHTGANLFDPEQPVLYYGVLSSQHNIDILAEKHICKIKSKYKIGRLHATELGNGGLIKILDDILSLQSRFNLNFDLYRISKVDHALICFFDQVFDSGVNLAVPWRAYWTPLRYILLLKVSKLFDIALLKRAWSARIERNESFVEKELSEICSILLNRIAIIPELLVFNQNIKKIF